jgi:SAM-dependent methyltransferase
LLSRKFYDFARESMPDRRRQRYGDMEYDWEKRVDTTSGTLGWRERLLGSFHSDYQPTEPAAFHEMLASLPINFPEYSFVDLGSGKGRALLMASEYPFRKIIGVELIPELHRAAKENSRTYRSAAQRCRQIECLLADAREYEFPEEPLVLYLFNPLPERALAEVVRRLDVSLSKSPRPIWIIYHNPLLEGTLRASVFLERFGGNNQCSVYRGVR